MQHTLTEFIKSATINTAFLEENCVNHSFVFIYVVYRKRSW